MDDKMKLEGKMMFSILIILLIILSYYTTSYAYSLTYDEENNNCKHMSQRLEQILEKFFIGVKIVVGTNPDESGNRHMWINAWGIDIDSVTLRPLSRENYKNCKEYGSFESYEEMRKANRYCSDISYCNECKTQVEVHKDIMHDWECSYCHSKNITYTEKMLNNPGIGTRE